MPTKRKTATRSWSPEEQKDIDRTVRALAMAGILDWESRNDELARPGRRRIDPPAATTGSNDDA